jgi:hypothetical protein
MAESRTQQRMNRNEEEENEKEERKIITEDK